MASLADFTEFPSVYVIENKYFTALGYITIYREKLLHLSRGSGTPMMHTGMMGKLKILSARTGMKLALPDYHRTTTGLPLMHHLR